MQLKTLGSGAVDVSEEAFGRAYNEALVHQVVTAYRAGGRSGTKAQKNRSQVRGGGAKPWRQKGTGRARAGTSRGPIWEGGGRTFAARPRKFDQKVNKKMYRAAMQSLVSELIRQDRLLVTENFSVDVPKTQQLVSKLESLKLNNVLIVPEAFDENLYLASRNIPNVEILPVTALDPVSLIRRERVLFTLPALKRLEEQLK